MPPYLESHFDLVMSVLLWNSCAWTNWTLPFKTWCKCPPPVRTCPPAPGLLPSNWVKAGSSEFLGFDLLELKREQVLPTSTSRKAGARPVRSIAPGLPHIGQGSWWSPPLAARIGHPGQLTNSLSRLPLKNNRPQLRSNLYNGNSCSCAMEY